jgi:hypothetical protein
MWAQSRGDERCLLGLPGGAGVGRAREGAEGDGMDSLFVCGVMLVLVAAMVAARLWVEGRMGSRGQEGNGEIAPGDRGAGADDWEEKGQIGE